MNMEITIAAEEVPQKINLTLVGKKYKINKIKSATAVRIARLAKADSMGELEMIDALDSLIVTIFGEKQAAAVQKRLDDPTDVLDYSHITQLVQAVMEVKSGDEENPTG